MAYKQAWFFRILPGMPSSVVAKMEYLPENRVLRIFYVSGAVYDYQDVPAEVYAAMQAASSKGRFLNAQIKEKYHYRRRKSA